MSESNDRRIDDVTPDTNVTGVEKVPVSDGGTAKFCTVEQIKDFVATKFAALSNADNVTVNSDGVYLKKDGELKPVAANVFADAIIAFMFDKESETELSETDEIVINRGGTAKVATVESLAIIIKEIIGTFDVEIEDKDNVDDLEYDDHVLISRGTNGEEPFIQYKSSIGSIVSFVSYYISQGGASEAVDEDDFICTVKNMGEGEPRQGIQLRNIGELPFGKGDVKGPSANTANKIPQWDGANSKTLKDGLNLATNITSQSGETEVPTALAVHNAVKDKVNAPSSNTANRIPQWNGANSKTLNDGLDFATEMGSTPSDAKILSEKAVSDAISAAFTSALASGGSIPQAISSAITAALTATGAIGSALAGKVDAPSSTTLGKIPYWDEDPKKLASGFDLVSSISGSSTNQQIPTALSVYSLFSTVSGGARISQYQPYDGQSGYPTGCLVYCTNESYEGLYINLGSDSQAIWKKIFAPAS